MSLGLTFNNRQSNNANGAIGLGYSINKMNLVTRLKEDRKINRAIFSYYKSDAASFLIIGDLDYYFAAEKFTQYDQPTSSTKWQLALADAKINNAVIAQPIFTVN